MTKSPELCSTSLPRESAGGQKGRGLEGGGRKRRGLKGKGLEGGGWRGEKEKRSERKGFGRREKERRFERKGVETGAGREIRKEGN
ncbi:MAG: hypothetical protein SOS98_05980 [Varibaculum sp.]|nr:hypothetical protein [Varibaculum sp.]